MTQIYTGLETLMNEDKVYRKSDLSLEKAATMLNTNRTYHVAGRQRKCGLLCILRKQISSSGSYRNSFRSEKHRIIKVHRHFRRILLSIQFLHTIPAKMGMSPSLFRRECQKPFRQRLTSKINNTDAQFVMNNATITNNLTIYFVNLRFR